MHHRRDNLEAFVNRLELVKVAFFGGLDTLQRIQDQQRAAGSRTLVASLVDFAGMKMRAIQVRGDWKDYVDIHAPGSHGIHLPTALAAAKAIDKSFDPETSIRTLQFYGPQRGLSPGGMEP